MNKNLSLEEAINNLPDHYHDTFSDSFLKLLAALQLHNFSIQRADEASPVVNANDLWPELSHPSVWIHSPTAPYSKLQNAEPDSPEHTQLTNEIIKTNLSDQQRLLTLLEAFYASHQPVSFAARLIVETIDLGESYLRSQGSSVRIISNESIQKRWAIESSKEFGAFAKFLVDSHK